MKERPILFSGPMIRALLAGRKSVTRRVVKPQPAKPICRMVHVGTCTTTGRKSFVAHDIKGKCVYAWPTRDGHGLEGDITAPFAVGARLWVKETWGFSAYYDDTDWLRGSVKGQSQDHLTESWKLRFAADYDGPASSEYPYWRPSIFMPRWASRLTLEVTEVRVERVQDISEADARAEGIEVCRDGDGTIIYGPHGCYTVDACDEFRRLWHSINGAQSWEDNPWVWVVGFRRVDG